MLEVELLENAIENMKRSRCPEYITAKQWELIEENLKEMEDRLGIIKEISENNFPYLDSD
jgi:hypothetical protein